MSKTRSIDEILQAHSCGQHDFGENYQQEALAKIAALQDKALCWHFIGPLQSNKAQAVAAHFSWLHSLDRLKIAKRLSTLRPQTLPALNVCLQVNISLEASKSGVHSEALPDLAAEVSQLPGLCLRGLMALPAPSDDLQSQREGFRKLRVCFEQLVADGHPLDTLSMGTSNDIEAAIAEGATMLRVGTALFGPRK